MLWSVIFGPGPSLGPEKPVRESRQFSSTVSNRHLLSVPSNFLGFSEGNLSLALDKGPLGLKVLAMIFESLNLQCKKQQSSWTLFSDCREVSPSQCEQIINTFVICISRDCYQAIVHIKMQFWCQSRGLKMSDKSRWNPFALCQLSGCEFEGAHLLVLGGWWQTFEGWWVSTRGTNDGQWPLSSNPWAL